MKTVAGMLGLVALGAAMVIGMLASFGAFGSKVAQESAAVGLEATMETTNQQAEQAAALGESVTTGDVSWTVTDATEETELHTKKWVKSAVVTLG